MKRYILIFLLIATALKLTAQGERPYTEAEMKRWSSLCCSLAQCITVKSYKDYTVSAQDCKSFDWAEMDFHDKNNPKPLTVINAKNQPVGNYPYYNITFKKNEDSIQLEENKVLLLIQDAVQDGKIDQQKMNEANTLESKQRANQLLSVQIRANVVADCEKQYYIGTKPVNLSIPNSSFAYLYLFPEGKQVLNEQGEGQGGTDAEAFYKDKALIILGAKPKVTTDPVDGKQSWKQDRIYPIDKASECIMQPIKNIWVEISGAETDVRAFIEKIDWKALAALIGK